ncbi:hypothetical protein [Treponema sp.]|uniref:hypothetical protein n=1 Tax=Treponema sp. TaxID=166 RepID=UPI003FD8A81F
MAKVLYYNIDDNLDYENSLFLKWGVSGLELKEIKGRDKPLYECVKNYDGLVVEYDQVTEEVMQSSGSLKCVSD